MKLPSNAHKAPGNPTELFQAVMPENARKWRVPGKWAQKQVQHHVACTKPELQAAIFKTGGRLVVRQEQFKEDECLKTVSHFSDQINCYVFIILSFQILVILRIMSKFGFVFYLFLLEELIFALPNPQSGLLIFPGLAGTFSVS